MPKKLLILLVVTAAAGFAIVALERGLDRSQTREGTSLPDEKTPTKENVSKVVREKIEHLKSVVARNPDDARSAFELAKMFQDGHNVPEAITYYEIGLKTDKHNAAARIDYSLCLYQSGRHQEAMAQNHAVLNDDPANPQALYNLGAIYANRAQGDSARLYWSRLIARHPKDELAEKARQNLKLLGGKPL